MKRSICACLHLAAFAGLLTVPCSKAESGYAPKTVSEWNSALNAFIPREICAPSDKCECDGGSGGGSGGSGQSATADPMLKCVQMDIGMGAPRYSALSGAIVLQLNELQASSRLYSPAGFHVVAGNAVHRVSRQTNAGGVPKWVQVSTPSGVVAEYVFADGESVGVPVSGREDVSSGRLAMVDAQGWAAAADPAFYDYYPGDGSRWRFGAAKNAPDYLGLIEHQTPQGRVETKQDLGLEILRDADGVLRQVATPARLADYVITGQDAYDLTVYPNDASCVTGARTAEGYCQIAAGAVPEVVWKFRNPVPGTYGVLEVTREMPGAAARTWRYEYVEAVQDFILKHPGGIKEERVERIESEDKKSRTVRKTELGPDGVAYSKKELRYETRGGSLEIVASVKDPGGLNLTTVYDYYTAGACAGLESLAVSPEGSWTRYEYDGQKRKTTEIRPWLDAPTNAPVEQCAITRYGYGLFASGDFLAYNDQRPRTVVNEICGIEVSRTYHAYPTNALGQAQEIEERAAFPGASYGHAANPRTVKTYYAATAVSPLPGRLATITYPGGKVEEYGYEYGTFNATTFVFTPDSDGGAWRETVTTSYGQNSGVQALRSARVWDEKGREVLNESYVEDGMAFARIGWTRMSYDRNGKLIETAYSDSRVESATWGANCCGKESATTAEGIVTVYGYNELKQKVSETKKGLAADGSDDITTLYTYDLESRVLSTAVTNVASGLGYVAARSAYDAVGRVTNVTDRLGNVTSISHAPFAITSRSSSGVISVNELYLDGKTLRILENGLIKQSYAYGVNADGIRWTLSAYGTLSVAIQRTLEPPNISALKLLDFPWQLEVIDPLGRAVTAYKPGFNGAILMTSNTYDMADNLIASTQYTSFPSSVNPIILSKNLYSYAADGSLYLTAFDLNTNTVIDIDGPDRITGTSSAYEKDVSNTWWRVARSWVYSEFDSLAAVTTSVQRVQLTGLGVRRGDDGMLTSHTEALDARGNATVSDILFDRTARRVTRFKVVPTSLHPAIKVKVNALLTSAVSAAAVTNGFIYDALGRQTVITDGRNNSSTTAYNALGQVGYIEDAATNRTSYEYDAFGRRTKVTDALGNVTHTAYDVEGRVVKTWGATYPLEYSYDSQGRMVSMKTFREENGAGDEIRWLYDNPSSLLTNKLYADGKGPAYAYTPDGKLSSRTWARPDPRTGEKLVTRYSYNAARLLTSVDYSDDTPDIAYTFDRLGNMASVIDVSGTRVFTYAPDGNVLNDTVQFGTEKLTLHENYDVLGRNSGYAVSNTVDGTSSLITGMSQSYDVFGRISEVSVADIPSRFRYGWLAGSDLQQSLIMPNGVTRQTVYDPQRNFAVSVVHTNAAGTVLTRRAFTSDAVGRLTARNLYRLGDETNRLDAFYYSQRSELTGAIVGTNAYAYTFDPIGNRQTAEEPDFSATYSVNTLNQYTNISYGQTSMFAPVFDLDGNQTLLKTTTGIWHVTYNAENRPIVFSNDTVVVEMAYDYMGRRVEYNETVYGIVQRHERYRYRNNLLIGISDILHATNALSGIVFTIVWDPTESVATRPLVMQKEGDWWCYGFDQAKNVCELYGSSGTIDGAYSYAINGNIISVSGDVTLFNKISFSSEINDFGLGLVYYNYRHLNMVDGRWICRDPLDERGFQFVKRSDQKVVLRFANQVEPEYVFMNNSSVMGVDYLGLWGWGGKDKKKEKKCCNPDNADLYNIVKNAGTAVPKIGTLLQYVLSAKGCLDAAKGPCKSWGEDNKYTGCLECCGAITSQMPGGIPTTYCPALCKPLNEDDGDMT